MVNNIQKDIINADGTIDTVILTSNDNYNINLPRNYKIANNNLNKGNKFVNKFKNSILGTEIGVKAEGYSNIAILATIVAVGAICLMYILWRL